MKPKILITGGSGFVGGHLVEAASENFEVHSTFLHSPVGKSNVVWHQIDLVDTKATSALVKAIRPSVIIHAAAQSNLDFAEISREAAFGINVQATEALAGSCEAVNSRFIYISSDMVFDGSKGNYSESDPVNPINYYGETKVLAEERAQQNCSNCLIARSALVYGRPLNKSSSFSEWIYNRLRNHQNVPLFYDQYRSPIWVDELAQALIECASNQFRGIIHLGGSDSINRLEFGIIFANLTISKILIN